MDTKSNKARVAAVGTILLALQPFLPVDSTAARIVAAVLAAGTTYGVWRVSNPPKTVSGSGRRPPFRP